jgi:hypothetical protein
MHRVDRFANILSEFKAKIGTARNVVQGIYVEPIYAKTSEIRPHCHVPLNRLFTQKGQKTHCKKCSREQGVNHTRFVDKNCTLLHANC